MRRYDRDAKGRFVETPESFGATLDEVEDEVRHGKYWPDNTPEFTMSLMNPTDRDRVNKRLAGPSPEERAKARADAKRQRARDRRVKAKDAAETQKSEDILVASLDGMSTMDVAQYKNHPNLRISARARQILFKRS